MSKIDVVWGGIKEHHFFSVHYGKGFDWYHDQLQNSYRNSTGCQGSVFDNKVVIEKSPSYMSVAESAKRAFEYNPEIKIIATLLNPVSRAFSRYQDILIDEPGRITKPFYEVILNSIKYNHHFTGNGYYAAQLRPYLNIFPRENILISIQERMKKTLERNLVV